MSDEKPWYHGVKWRVKALGGCSTVLCDQQPKGDTSIPPYAHDVSKGYCVAHPFQYENSSIGRTEMRLDFVAFGHQEADLIAAAPETATERDQLKARVAELERKLDLSEKAGLKAVLGEQLAKAAREDTELKLTLYRSNAGSLHNQRDKALYERNTYRDLCRELTGALRALWGTGVCDQGTEGNYSSTFQVDLDRAKAVLSAARDVGIEP